MSTSQTPILSPDDSLLRLTREQLTGTAAHEARLQELARLIRAGEYARSAETIAAAMLSHKDFKK